MKSFKQFLKENMNPVQGQLDKNGYPCAYVDNVRKVNESDYNSWKNKHDNEHIGEDNVDVMDLLHRHQKTHGIDPANPFHSAMLKYTKNSSHLNKTLFANHVQGNPNPDIIESGLQANNTQVHHLPTLDTALTQHKLKVPLSVYSGVKFNPSEVASRHPENIIHLPAYTSTSISKSTANGFAHGLEDGNEHIIHFHLPVGHHGVFVGQDSEKPEDAKPMSNFPEENEFILPRNTKVKIHPTPEIVKSSTGKGNLHIWHAHPVKED